MAKLQTDSSTEKSKLKEQIKKWREEVHNFMVKCKIAGITVDEIQSVIDSNIILTLMQPENIKKELEHFRSPHCGNFICINPEVWERIWSEWIK